MQVDIILRSDLSQKQSTEVQVSPLLPNQRFMVAAKKAGLFFLFAFVSIFVPVLHFVLVPLFLLVMVWTFFHQYKFKTWISEFKYTCPGCKQQAVVVAQAFAWPLYFNCDHCHAKLKIDPEA